MIDRRAAIKQLAAGSLAASCSLQCDLRKLIAAHETERDESLLELSIGELQFLGTHNSYHVAPDRIAADLIRLVAPNGVQQLEYTHPTLTDQLTRLGIRQFEWDLYRDDQGGRYAEPAAWKLALEQDADVPVFDPDGLMKAPGIKILHAPDFDYRSQNLTLQSAWEELLAWSQMNPNHEPVFLLLELKDESYLPTTHPEAWDDEGMLGLEAEILRSVPRDRLLTPRDLMRDHDTLRDSIVNEGWPKLGELLEKFVLLLDNEGGFRDRYLELDGGWSERLLFTSVDESHDAAGWMKINNPIESEERIKRLVERGFLIRTRADSGLEPRFNGRTQQRDAALRSGAQLVSTDFPELDPLAPEYSTRMGEGVQMRRRND